MKKYKLFIIVFIFVLIGILGIFALNKLRGHGYLSAVKGYVHYWLNKPDFTQYEPLATDEDAWYQDNTLIAHALGGVDETDYTNSKEALLEAVNNGYRVFEVDFSVTSDGRVVCAHDFAEFEEIPDYETFMNTKIKGKYSTLDVESLIDYFTQNKDLYLMTDFKWDNSFGSKNNDVEIIMDTLTETIARYDEALIERVIIQVYSENNYIYISENYPYKNYVYTLYNFAYPIYDEVAATCLKHQIPVVTMHYSRATKEHVDILKKWNIQVFSHTVNDMDEVILQKQNGVTGIYTDWILPAEME